MIKAYLPFTFIDVQKQIYRSNSIDAFALYYSLLNHVIALMNIKYRPARFDFGPRYLHCDFPQKEQQILENLMYVKSLEQLQLNLFDIKALSQELIKELEDTFSPKDHL